jgi:hypothetical protein
MTEYRDVLGASLERMEQLERDLDATRRGQPQRDALALRLENELLEIEREWRDKQARLASVEDRRRRRLKLASSALFLVLSLSGIALLFRADLVAGMVCFVASVVGWILSGLQESRHGRLMRLYEEDRLRVERVLRSVRARMGGVRVAAEAELEAPAPVRIGELAPVEVVESGEIVDESPSDGSAKAAPTFPPFSGRSER